MRDGRHDISGTVGRGGDLDGAGLLAGHEVPVVLKPGVFGNEGPILMHIQKVRYVAWVFVLQAQQPDIGN